MKIMEEKKQRKCSMGTMDTEREEKKSPKEGSKYE